MFLRFIRLVVREGAEASFQAFYRERVIPALSEVPGCQFAGLLTPWRSEEHRSLTLWRSADDARAYEESGLYQVLLRESMPYLSARTVWRARPTDAATLDAAPTLEPGRGIESLETIPPPAAGAAAADAPEVVREIAPEGYELSDAGARASLTASTRPVFVRVVAVHVRPDCRERFDGQYRDLVRPAMLEAPGCIGAFLAEGTRDRNEALSISVWEREEGATRFEMTAEYDRIRRTVRETLSPLSPWQLEIGEGGERAAGAGVASYRLVHGRRLEVEPAE